MINYTGCADAMAAMSTATPAAAVTRAAEIQAGRAPRKHSGSPAKKVKSTPHPVSIR